MAQDYYSLKLPVSADIGNGSPTLVLQSSPEPFRKQVETFAKYFQREMQFDFPQFEAAETSDKPWFVSYEAYLFHEGARDIWFGEGPLKQRSFGACCFRWREYTNAPAEWVLDWAWFHPFFRRRGHLQKSWPLFVEKYGNFNVQQPVSNSMQSLLNKVGWQAT